MYDDAIDYRTNTIRPRHTIATYYYAKTTQKIEKEKMNLTIAEIKEYFKKIEYLILQRTHFPSIFYLEW